MQLEFRVAYDNPSIMAFAACRLHIAAPQFGWVLLVSRLTQQVVQAFSESLDEPIKKCLLEMCDRDLMEASGLDLEMPDGEWEPVDVVQLGIVIYIDNVGKSKGITPVLSLRRL